MKTIWQQKNDFNAKVKKKEIEMKENRTRAKVQ